MASILKVNTIQDATNSTTAQTIDTSGRIAYPAQPRFLCRLASNSTISSGYDADFSVNNASWNVVFNIGNMFSSGTVTFPTDGVYHIHFQMYANPTSSGGGEYIGGSMNGSAVTETYGTNDLYVFRARNNDSGYSHSALFNATAGKSLQFGTYHAAGATYRGNHTFIWGYKLG